MVNHQPTSIVQSVAAAKTVETHETIVVPAKDKTVAVLLAVFLGYWSWLYTYSNDAWKFWVSLGVVAGLTILILPTLFLSLFFLPFAIFGSWLWAVIDVATKPDEYYSNFHHVQ